MTKPTNKEIFTCLGSVTPSPTGLGHEFTAKSEKYLADQLNRLPLNKEVTVTFYEHKATRSGQQLSYHWVLIDYIAKYSGNTKEEMHDIMMKQVFGIRKINFMGKEYECRHSISESARMSLQDCVELINKDIEVCSELGINVPTAEELGYATEK